jgi:hypothetical protein
MLFEPERHEALCSVPWDESRVRNGIRSIVDDIEEHRRSEGGWPVHPLDAGRDPTPTGFESLYYGSAGVLWALWYLGREGAAELRGDPAEGIRKTESAYRAHPDTGQVVPSYLLGEAGILLVLWRLTGSLSAKDRLFASVKSNLRNPTNEALWAAPGTMLAAWHVYEATGEASWRDLFLDNVEQVWKTWLFDARSRCHLWTQALYGKVVRYLGAGHGFAGNAYPLLRGASLLEESRREVLYERCAATVRVTARRADGAVNWPPDVDDAPSSGAGMLMQWCHGAPGVVAAMSQFPPGRSPELDVLLQEAGDAIWQAGPLTKGYGLCHGTAGNGYAFLKLFQRTGERIWLDRARSFAMHAFTQRDRMRRHHGRGRYALWTGDPGLAVYAWHCIRGAGGLPGLDVLQ